MKRILTLIIFFTVFLTVKNAFCLTMPVTDKGSIAFVVESFTSQPSGYSTYFLISDEFGSRTFSYSKRITSNGLVHELTFMTNGKYNYYTFYDYDSLQDIVTIVYTPDTVRLYIDGELLNCSQCNIVSPDISGNIILWSDNVVEGTFTYFPQVFTDSQVLNGIETYKSYGNFGVNSIDIIFNALFKLLKRVQQ